MPITRVLPDVVLLAVAATWGGSYLGAKDLAEASSAPAVMCLRFVPAAVVLLGVAAGRGKLRALHRLAVPGVCLGILRAATIALETIGVTRTSATNAGLIIGLSVLMTPIFEAAAVRRRLSGQLVAAMLLGVVGIALLVGGGGFSAPSGGDLLMLGAAVTRALLGVAEARFTRAGAAGDADVLQLTAIELTLGAGFFAAWGGHAALAHVPEFTGHDWANLVYLTVGCTLLAFVGQLWATKHTSASRASILLGTEPGWALVVGIVLAGEAIGAASMAGALILLVAVTWGGRAEYRWRTNKPHRRTDGHGRPPLTEAR
jgi:drug/metabolite transporter (DMT)-like permease